MYLYQVGISTMYYSTMYCHVLLCITMYYYGGP